MPNLLGQFFQVTLKREYTMLKPLTLMLIRNIFRLEPKTRYRARVSPALGESVAAHEGMDTGLFATRDKTKNFTEQWRDDEAPTAYPHLEHCSVQELSLSASDEINPASGLPMMDGIYDIAGNTFWTNVDEAGLSAPKVFLCSKLGGYR